MEKSLRPYLFLGFDGFLSRTEYRIRGNKAEIYKFPHKVIDSLELNDLKVEPLDPTWFKSFLGLGSLKISSSTGSMTWENLSNIEAVKDALNNRNVASCNSTNAKKTVPFGTEKKFNTVERFGLSSEYSSFICPYPKYHELTIEQIIHKSEELLSFVERNPEKAVTKLLLVWIHPRYFSHLHWVFTQLDIDSHEAEGLKKRFENFQDPERLEEKFHVLLERHAKADKESQWITRWFHTFSATGKDRISECTREASISG